MVKVSLEMAQPLVQIFYLKIEENNVNPICDFLHVAYMQW